MPNLKTVALYALSLFVAAEAVFSFWGNHAAPEAFLLSAIVSLVGTLVRHGIAALSYWFEALHPTQSS